MTVKKKFEAVLQKHPSLNATSITIPFDVEDVFGAKRVPVKVTVNRRVYRGSIVRMGGIYCVGIPKEFRELAGIDAGDNIVVTVEKDEESRIVEPPAELAEALSQNKAAALAWEKLSYTHKREHARAIEDAKRSETRSRRIEKTIEMLTGGRS